MSDGGRTLVVNSLRFPADTGAYKCQATNEAGSSQDIATLFVEKTDVPTNLNGRRSHPLHPTIYPVDRGCCAR